MPQQLGMEYYSQRMNTSSCQHLLSLPQSQLLFHQHSNVEQSCHSALAHLPIITAYVNPRGLCGLCTFRLKLPADTCTQCEAPAAMLVHLVLKWLTLGSRFPAAGHGRSHCCRVRLCNDPTQINLISFDSPIGISLVSFLLIT